MTENNVTLNGHRTVKQQKECLMKSRFVCSNATLHSMTALGLVHGGVLSILLVSLIS
jgi:hypothetical protein